MTTAYLTNHFRCVRHRVISQSATTSAVTSRSRRSRRHLTGGNLVDIFPRRSTLKDDEGTYSSFVWRALKPPLIGYSLTEDRKSFRGGGCQVQLMFPCVNDVRWKTVQKTQPQEGNEPVFENTYFTYFSNFKIHDFL